MYSHLNNKPVNVNLTWMITWLQSVAIVNPMNLAAMTTIPLLRATTYVPSLQQFTNHS